MARVKNYSLEDTVHYYIGHAVVDGTSQAVVYMALEPVEASVEFDAKAYIQYVYVVGNEKISTETMRHSSNVSAASEPATTVSVDLKKY